MRSTTTSQQAPSATRLLAAAFALLVMAAVAPVNTFAQGTYTQTYLPSAYGTYAFVGNTVIVNQTAPTSLAGYCGTPSYPMNASGSAVGVTVLPLITGGAANTSVTDDFRQANAQSVISSVSLLGGLISARQITAASETTLDESGTFHVNATGSSFSNLVVLGHAYGR